MSASDASAAAAANAADAVAPAEAPAAASTTVADPDSGAVPAPTDAATSASSESEAASASAPAEVSAEVAARFAPIIAAYGMPLFQRIHAAKLLVVGAGGIGCELLKNLVLTGFCRITVLDLDTIDVSNLNRQFLFRRPHVGQSKSRVAVAAVSALYPPAAATLVPLHDNVKSPQFDHDFFKGFDLVMNALDNLEARRHVNRLCISAGRTLLESGTQGYAGQTTVIQAGATECFECQPVPSAKTFAVCTIRNTPDKPVHAIVWAKSVYQALFGPEEEGNIMSDARMDVGAAVEQEKAVASETVAADAAGNPLLARFSAFGRSVFEKLFNEEIQKQCEVKERWANRAPPTPLGLASLLSALPSSPALPHPLTSAYFRQRDQSVFTPSENALFLLHTVRTILLERTEELGQLTFDKDDELALDFVSAASNLRMANFGIQQQSRFSVKGIAGNIVHAIATTNAIAAGLMVTEAIKLLNGRMDQCHTTWITRRGPALLSAQRLNEPNPKCYVCAHSTQELHLDTNQWTLKRLFQQVLRQKLSMNEPGIDVINREYDAQSDGIQAGGKCASNFIGTEDDHEDEPAYLSLPLSSPGVRIDHGALLSVEDQSQKLSVQLRIVQREEWNEEETPEMFVLGAGRGATPAAVTATATVPAADAKEAAPVDEPVTNGTAASAPDSSNASAPAAPADAATAPSSTPIDVDLLDDGAPAASAAPLPDIDGAAAAAPASSDGASLKRKAPSSDVEEVSGDGDAQPEDGAAATKRARTDEEAAARAPAPDVAAATAPAASDVIEID